MAYFIAGTDTDSGKTLVSSALLHLATSSGKTSVGLKPIASGSLEVTVQRAYSSTDTLANQLSITDPFHTELQNSDALSLVACSSIKLPYQQVNPFAFEPAIAPHIAAAQAGVCLSVQTLLQQVDVTYIHRADFGLIEGAGGWRLPLNQDEFFSDVVKAWQLPVILVVGVKLGCLNHALLTQEAILTDGLVLAGWVANQVDADVSCFEENLSYLAASMKAPCIGVIPYLAEPSASHAADYLDLSLLMPS